MGIKFKTVLRQFIEDLKDDGTRMVVTGNGEVRTRNGLRNGGKGAVDAVVTAQRWW